jgi:hypothetical protein
MQVDGWQNLQNPIIRALNDACARSQPGKKKDEIAKWKS